MSNRSPLNALGNDLSGDVFDLADTRDPGGRPSFYHEYDERRPLATVRVADASDVSKTIAFARDTGVPVAVRGGGHSIAGHSSLADGLIIDLSALTDIDIDVEGRMARAGGGVLAGDYTVEAGRHGLATGFGDTPTVGIAGLTMGGGVGFLHRKLGLTIDSLLAAEIVTADGEIRMIDDENDPDLFWAIRGGGGNFGVVTRLHYRLHPVETVVGGMLILPASPKVVADFVGAAREASDDLSVIGGVAVAPPAPFLPPEVHGQMVVLGVMAHTGDADTANAELDRFRGLATPLVDGLQTMRYPEIFAGAEPPRPAAISMRSIVSDEFTADDAAAVVDRLSQGEADMNVVQIRVLGGAVARVPVEATAFAHRHRAMIVNVGAAFEDPSRRAEHEMWVEGLARTLQHGGPGAYINFLGDDSPEAVRAAYPESTWERLVEVKGKYDQDNLFSSNHNIAPRR